MTYKAEGQYVSVCLRCGKPMKKHERAFRVRDPMAIDFEERETVDFLAAFCSDCKEEMLRWHSEGIRGAVARQQEKIKQLRDQDSSDKEKRAGALPAG